MSLLIFRGTKVQNVPLISEMTRTTPELAPPLQASPAGGRLATAYDLACNRPHTRQIFGGIGSRTLRSQIRDLTTSPPRPS
ncbi:hypothetical protein AVEN_126391-1 [Araneus ventricosus]|uniref:Uncharacterized protein n=1 Tax=Araneus ventricosus TaxID=182803 RepID=A0A4Y2GFC4_ARAVE|nr:hypothetical protein AVEN_126391-1 [Araneus ventricosus]